MRAIDIHPLARLDIHEITAWYDARREKYGQVFEEEFDRCVELLVLHPETHRLVLPKPGIRRALMPNFLYQVYYSTEPDRIKIWAVVHAHRSPRFWKRQIRKRG